MATKSMKLSGLKKALVIAKDEADNDLPLQHLVVFLEVAMSPGNSGLELCEKLDMSQASMSRALSALGTIHRQGKPGLKWVITREDDYERRRKVSELTTKGKTILSKMMEALA